MLLLVDNEANELDFSASNCTTITLRADDITSTTALKAKVLTTLSRMTPRVRVPDRAPGWLDSDPEVDICIA